MKYVSSKFTTYLCVLSLSMALTGCEDPAVEVGTLGKKLSAPTLKGQSPFDQSFDSQNYVHVSGTCDSRVGDLSVSFKIGASNSTTAGGTVTGPTAAEIASAAKWQTPPTTPDTTGTSLAAGITNDVNCADGVFDFYLTKNDLYSLWGFDGTATNIDVNTIYLKGSTLIGDTQVLSLMDPKAGSGSGGNVATKIVLEKQWPRGFAGSGHCEGFNVFLSDGNNNYASSSTPVTFSISQVTNGTSSTTIGYASWDACNKFYSSAVAGVNTFTIPAGQNSIMVMLPMPTDSGSFDQTFSFRAISSGLTTAPNDSLILRDSASTRRWVAVDPNGGNRILKDLCYPVKFARYTYAGSAATTDAALSVNPTPANAKLKYYSDGACTTAVTSFLIPASTASVDGYMKYNSDATDTTAAIRIPVSFTNIVTDYDFAPYKVDVDLNGSTTVTKLDFWGPNETQRGTCNAYKVVRTNDHMTPIPDASSSIVVSLTSTVSGTFYDSSSCTSATSQITIPSNSADALVYFRPAVDVLPGTYAIAVSATGLTSMTRDLKVSAAPATTFSINGMYGSMLPENTCGGIRIYTYDFNSQYSAFAPIDLLYYTTGLTNPTDAKLYTDANCTTEIATNTATTLQPADPTGHQFYLVYVKSVATSGSNFGLNMQVNFGTSSAAQNFNIYLTH